MVRANPKGEALTMTQKVRRTRDDWKGECLQMVKEALQRHGVEMNACPPMFYPEAIHNLFVWGIMAALACCKAHGNQSQEHQVKCISEWIRERQKTKDASSASLGK
jgi:hypothetical protein